MHISRPKSVNGTRYANYQYISGHTSRVLNVTEIYGYTSPAKPLVLLMPHYRHPRTLPRWHLPLVLRNLWDNVDDARQGEDVL